MKNKFKVGDKIRCVDDTDIVGGRHKLIKGAIYEISGFHISGDVLLHGIKNPSDAGYSQSRFELVKEEVKQMRNLKIGDKVRYVRNIGAFHFSPSLVLGTVYTVESLLVPHSPASDVRLVEMGCNGCYSQKRFELVEEENKIMNKKPAAFYISIKDPIVSEFIQKLLLKNGITWYGKKPNEIQDTDKPYLFVSFNTRTWGENKLFCSHCKESDFEAYDAVKDLQKIMEFVETPSMPLPVVNNYTMSEYKSGHTSVVFGCAHISIRLLRGVLKLMEEEFTGNRQLDKIVLNSGVTLTKDDVKNILKYVDFENKK